jgi:hypothetical protein
MFPVRYELNFYILFRNNSVAKCLNYECFPILLALEVRVCSHSTFNVYSGKTTIIMLAVNTPSASGHII